MASVSVPQGVAPEKIRLPRSSSRLSIPRAYCQVITGIRRMNGCPMPDGPFYAPGVAVSLPPPGLVLECAGPVHPNKARSDVLWILWRRGREEWLEVGRALAVNWEWALVLGPIAEALLREPACLYDLLARGRDVAAEALKILENRLSEEAQEVQKHVWLSLYDQLPGRILDKKLYNNPSWKSNTPPFREAWKPPTGYYSGCWPRGNPRQKWPWNAKSRCPISKTGWMRSQASSGTAESSWSTWSRRSRSTTDGPGLPYPRRVAPIQREGPKKTHAAVILPHSKQ